MPEYSPQELVEKWEEFFDAFDYAGRILSVADAYPETRSLEVPFEELNRFDTDFAIYLLNRPANAIAAGEEAITRVAPPGDVPIRVHLRVKGIPRDARIMVRDLRAEHLGRFVTVDGLVRKATEVRPKVVDATFRCLRCNATFREAQEGTAFREPLECPADQGGCGRAATSTKFLLLGEQSQYLDTQKIEIQEPPEILRGGEEPQRLEAYLEDDITGQITPGERVVLNGILRSAQRGRPGAKSTIFDIFLDINSVEKEQVEFEEIEITPADAARIREEAARPGVLDRIIQSIAPAVYGLEKEKEALALQLFGGVSKELPDGTRIRGDSHLLLVGDPGVAKSQLLLYMSQIAPRAIMVSGKGTSAAGLLAAAVRDEFGEGRWTLEAGALVLADRGLACLHPDSEVFVDGLPRPVHALFDPSRSFRARAAGRDIEISPLGRPVEALDLNTLANWTPRAAFVTRRQYRGPMVTLSMESGVRLRVTPDHLVLDGETLQWRPAGEFARGDRIVALQKLSERKAPVFLLDILPDDWIVQPSPAEKAELRARLRERFGTLAEANRRYGLRREALSGRDALRVDEFRAILRDVGLYGSWRTRPHAFGRNDATEALRVARFTPELAYVLGLCYGDGHVAISRRRTSFQVTQSRVHRAYVERLLRASKAASKRPGRVSARRADRRPDGTSAPGRSYVLYRSSSVLGYLYEWITGDDLANLLRLDDESLRGFLAGAMDADGCISVRRCEKDGVEYRNVNIELLLTNGARAATRLLWALRRFDVFARIRPRRGVLAIQITSRSDVERLLDVLRPFSAKFKEVPGRKAEISSRHEEIPRGPVQAILRGVRPPAAPLIDSGLCTAFYELRKGRRRPYKGTMNRLLSVLSPWMTAGQRERLEALAGRDYAVDRIAGVTTEPYEGYVYDLRVPEGENFLCDGLVVHNCIDEIEKMNPQDRGSIHQAMEEQMVHISKAGITATLPARCAVLAAANPQFGRFVREKYLGDQINLEPALLSRFDAIFVIQDIPDAKRDKDMADHILQGHLIGEVTRARDETGTSPVQEPMRSTHVPYYEPEFLRKYVAYAKRFYPVMTPDAMARIRDHYLEIRKEAGAGTVPITPRQLEAFVRLAEASARARLSPLVEVQDADRAVGIIEYWLRQVAMEAGAGHIDIDIVATGVPASQRDQIVRLRDIIAELGGTETGPGANYEDILSIAEQRGIPRERAEAWLRKWKQEGELYSPQEGVYRLVARL